MQQEIEIYGGIRSYVLYATVLLLREGQRIFDEPIVASHDAMHYMHLHGFISGVLISCVGNTIVEYCIV